MATALAFIIAAAVQAGSALFGWCFIAFTLWWTECRNTKRPDRSTSSDRERERERIKQIRALTAPAPPPLPPPPPSEAPRPPAPTPQPDPVSPALVPTRIEPPRPSVSGVPGPTALSPQLSAPPHVIVAFRDPATSPNATAASVANVKSTVTVVAPRPAVTTGAPAPAPVSPTNAAPAPAPARDAAVRAAPPRWSYFWVLRRGMLLSLTFMVVFGVDTESGNGLYSAWLQNALTVFVTTGLAATCNVWTYFTIRTLYRQLSADVPAWLRRVLWYGPFVYGALCMASVVTYWLRRKVLVSAADAYDPDAPYGVNTGWSRWASGLIVLFHALVLFVLAFGVAASYWLLRRELRRFVKHSQFDTTHVRVALNRLGVNATLISLMLLCLAAAEVALNVLSWSGLVHGDTKRDDGDAPDVGFLTIMFVLLFPGAVALMIWIASPFDLCRACCGPAVDDDCCCFCCCRHACSAAQTRCCGDADDAFRVDVQLAAGSGGGVASPRFSEMPVASMQR